MAAPLAIGAVYQSHAKLVRDLARAILGSGPEAEDLVQDVFLALCERDDFDPERGSVGAFLIAMTRSRAIDRLRGRCRRARFRERCCAAEPLSAESCTPFEDVARTRAAERLRAGLAALPAAERRVLELGYYGGLTQREIAAGLATSLGRVKSLWRRGLAGLAESITAGA